MAKNGFRILDSDLHLEEPPDLWQRYVDPPFKHLAPVGTQNGVTDLSMNHPDGRRWGQHTPVPTPPGHSYEHDQERYTRYFKMGWSAQGHLEAMDVEGIDVAFLYPSRGLRTVAEEGMDPPLAAALARAYNNWLYDYCQADPRRLLGVAMVSPFDVDDAVAETRRAVKELGFRGIFLRANVVTGRNWYDPYYGPLWSTLEELDVPLGFHEAGGSGAPFAGELFDNFMLRHAYSHPLEQMLALGAICAGGVLQRHPRLRVAFLEGNCSWVQWLLWRLDEHWELYADQWPPAAEMKMVPSEYFKRQAYLSVDCDEEAVKYAIEALGTSRNIVFSTDFPHSDARYPHSVDTFLELPISHEDKQQILWDNCAALYGMGVAV
ncbi:MAG TPA: amidohydrolase family protein [Chloroflexota bacterium]|nr:amidohydrolase family protein [Chloroflexota bacterium]